MTIGLRGGASVEPKPITGSRSGDGFTLVELLYVLTLVGVLLGIAGPLLNVDRFRVNSAVIEVATELMAAQRSAILRGHDIVVAVNPVENRLRVHVDANNDGLIQSTESWKVLDLQEGVILGLSEAPEMSIEKAPVTFKKKQGVLPAITFHRNGSASERGFLYLTGRGGGGQGKNDRAIEVIRSTAKIKCWSFQTGTWMETC
jgi:prepilin-type N-terminal cleavage/methylation domain-containing protein